jgi:hypothetical protein
MNTSVFCAVKTKIRILSVVLLTAIYCYAIGIATATSTQANPQYYSTTSEKEYCLDFSTKLFYHTSQYESSVDNCNNQPTLNIKNPFGFFNTLWAHAKTTEQLFESVITQYINIAKNLLIRYRKSDLIFPFHYFW